jgi:hypothetical protein
MAACAVPGPGRCCWPCWAWPRPCWWCWRSSTRTRGPRTRPTPWPPRWPPRCGAICWARCRPCRRWPSRLRRLQPGAKRPPRCCARARGCGVWSAARCRARCWTKSTRPMRPRWCRCCRARTWAWRPNWPARPPAARRRRCSRAATSFRWPAARGWRRSICACPCSKPGNRWATWWAAWPCPRCWTPRCVCATRGAMRCRSSRAMAHGWPGPGCRGAPASTSPSGSWTCPARACCCASTRPQAGPA